MPSSRIDSSRLPLRAGRALGIAVDPGRAAGLEYEHAEVMAAKHPPAAHRKADR
jgi:hypothetical protein